MEFLKCPDVRWKGPEKRNNANVVATTAKHHDSRSQISRYGKLLFLYKVYGVRFRSEIICSS